MFNVYLHDGEKPLPTDDVCYIIAKDGIYLKKKLGVMESIAPVKEISILKSIQPTAKMNIKKIPAIEFGRVFEFFRAVYQAHQSESIVLLFYNEAEKKYRIVPPHQKVTSAGAEYDRGIVMEGFTMVGTIHSHANFSAFHSGTDINDEMNFDGLHITIGHVASDNPSITACIVANGHRVVVPPEDYASGIIKENQVKKPPAPVIHNPAITGKQVYRIVNGALVRDIPGYDNQTRSYSYTPSYSSWRDDTRYLFTIPAGKRKFPETWLTLVEKGTYTYNWRGNQHRGNPNLPYIVGDEWWGAYDGGDWEGMGWGGHFDSSYWKNRNTTPAVQQSLPGQSTGPIVINNGEAPCVHCKYRDFKVQEEDFDIWYKCTKCNVTIKEDEDAEITVCPRCKEADHLEEIEDFGLIDKFVPVAQRVFTRNIKQVEVKKESTFHKCKDCGTTFNRFDSQAECPFCFAKIKDVENYSKEEEIHTQAASDSGEFLNPEFEAAQEAASEANIQKVREAIADMKEQEKTIERIPDPEVNSIPIKERTGTPPLSKGVIREMFKRVFGGKGNA